MAKYARTRMNKHITGVAAAVSTGESIHSFQIENGAEELQIKRINLTAASDSSAGNLYAVYFAIADEPFTTSADFSDLRTIVKSVWGPGSRAEWNETQTIRLPRGYYCGVMIDGAASNPGPSELAWASVQVNYLVLA